jgi:phosphoglycerate kinase
MKRIGNVDVENKKVIVRVDFNVPIKNGKIVDDTRIISSLKTIKYLVDNNAKVILLSHLGRIESEEDKEKNSLEIVAKHLSVLIKTPIYFCPVTRGDMLESEVSNLQNGEILLVENTRYEDYPKKLESSCDENLSKYWASLGDIFVLDAFGTAHRCHASTYGISNYIPSFAGFLLADEILMLENAIHEKKTLILGGSKVEDKLGVIDNLVSTSDFILLGGAMCFTFLSAEGYSMGSSIVSEDKLDYCKNLLKDYPEKIILPVDVVTQNGVKKIDELNPEDIGYDLGPETIELYKSILRNSKFIMWNGPLGKYEEKEYENATKKIMQFLSKEKIKTLIAGGDIISAANKFCVTFDYVSTGGGSTLEFLEGKKFKTLENLNGYKENN